MSNKLKVWWIPQGLMANRFEVNVNSLEEARLLSETLASYDYFQFENKIKPYYASASGLEMFEDNEWCDWYNEEFECFDEYVEYLEDSE